MTASTEEVRDLEIVRIGILTPYLFDDVRDRCDEEYIKDQEERYGYDRDNLIQVPQMITSRHRVLIETPDNCAGPSGFPQLVIHGSTRPAEERVESIKGSGIVVARYSIFYGGPSHYSGSYPEDAGYALDIPKSPDLVRSLLTHEGFLDGLVSREEGKIRSALEEFGSGLEEPVLVTPYLTEALAVQR